jgi:hypothetical protein
MAKERARLWLGFPERPEKTLQLLKLTPGKIKVFKCLGAN